MSRLIPLTVASVRLGITISKGFSTRACDRRRPHYKGCWRATLHSALFDKDWLRHGEHLVWVVPIDKATGVTPQFANVPWAVLAVAILAESHPDTGNLVGELDELPVLLIEVPMDAFNELSGMTRQLGVLRVFPDLAIDRFVDEVAVTAEPSGVHVDFLDARGKSELRHGRGVKGILGEVEKA